MNASFECIEKHLYRRRYQTAGGEWSTLYYAIFTDWKKKRRAFPLGSDLKILFLREEVPRAGRVANFGTTSVEQTNSLALLR